MSEGLLENMAAETHSMSHIHTSSTARGGGKNFKNGKRIGEMGCCESRMTKQKH